MTLTPDEIRVAETMIKRFKRTSRHWPVIRWAGILISALTLLLGIYTRDLLDPFVELIKPREINEECFTPEGVSAYVNISINYYRLKLDVSRLSAIIIGLSCGFLFFFIVERDRGVRCKFLARILSATIDKNKDTEPSPPVGRGGAPRP